MIVLETDLKFPKIQGKVRDVYDLGEYLLLVATDRVSAFDWVLPTGVPDKGSILTGLSEFWFWHLGVRSHFISSCVEDFGLSLSEFEVGVLRGRSMLVRKVSVVPFECVVRGYLSGSGWKEYCESGSVCGIRLPDGLVEGDRIDPIFTPATKVNVGHDENVSFEVMVDSVGIDVAESLRAASISVYERAAARALSRGLLLADTKFEWGFDGDGEIMLVDEVLTPDSSRYWDSSGYCPGRAQVGLDKQFVRDWLLNFSGWDRVSSPPGLPESVIIGTRNKYIECFERLTGRLYG